MHNKFGKEDRKEDRHKKSMGIKASGRLKEDDEVQEIDDTRSITMPNNGNNNASSSHSTLILRIFERNHLYDQWERLNRLISKDASSRRYSRC